MGNNSITREAQALERLSELILLNDTEVTYELAMSLQKLFLTLQTIHAYDFISVADIFEIQSDGSIKKLKYEEFIKLCIERKIISEQNENDLLVNLKLKNFYKHKMPKDLNSIKIDNVFGGLDFLDEGVKAVDKKIKKLVLTIFKHYEKNNDENIYLLYFKLSILISVKLKTSDSIDDSDSDFISDSDYLTLKHLEFIDDYIRAIGTSFTIDIDSLLPNNVNDKECKNATSSITTFRDFYLTVESVRKMTDTLTKTLDKFTSSENIINIICIEFNVTHKTVKYKYLNELNLLTPKKAKLSNPKQTHLVRDMSPYLEDFKNLISKLNESVINIYVRTYIEQKYSVDFKRCTSLEFYKTKFNESSKHIFHIKDIQQSCIYIDLKTSSNIEDIFKLLQIIFGKFCSSIYFENYAIKLFPLSNTIGENILTSLSIGKLLNM